MTLHTVLTIALAVVVVVQNFHLIGKAIEWGVDHWPWKK